MKLYYLSIQLRKHGLWYKCPHDVETHPADVSTKFSVQIEQITSDILIERTD